MFERRVRVGESQLQSHRDSLLVGFELLCGVQHSDARVEKAVRVQYATDLRQLLVRLHLWNLLEQLVRHRCELRGDGGNVVGENIYVTLVVVEVQRSQERIQRVLVISQVVKRDSKQVVTLH